MGIINGLYDGLRDTKDLIDKLLVYQNNLWIQNEYIFLKRWNLILPSIKTYIAGKENPKYSILKVFMLREYLG